MCLAWPKWDAIIVLLFGAAYEALAYNYNLGRVSNASSLWLGMKPPDIFVYIFLPPFLFDAAIKIDFFMLKKRAADIIVLAFVMVVASCLILIPLLLDALNLKAEGWTATEVALFGACIASTDAASVAAVLSSGGAPEILSLLLEGESLFNDASSLTLFSIFIELVAKNQSQSLGDQIASIVVGVLWSVFTGIAIGLLSGIFTLLCFMWMQHRNLDPKAEVALTVGMAYLSFYIAQFFCKGSGCVSSVVFGLFGSATLLFGMSQGARQTLVFPQFWNVLIFLINSLIFFYVGSASVNFAIRTGQSLYGESGLSSLFTLTLYRLPVIWLASFALRGIFLFLSSHFLKFTRLSEGLGWKEIVFVTIGGLRGSLSLVLAQAVAAEQHGDHALTDEDRRVRAQIAILITGFVILTLLVNAPLCGPLLTLLKLDAISEESILMRRHVKDLVSKYAVTSLEEFQEEEDEDEMLQGVDWEEVKEQIDMTEELHAALSEEQPFIDWFGWLRSSKKALKRVGESCFRGRGAESPEDREKSTMRDMHRASALHDIHRASAIQIQAPYHKPKKGNPINSSPKKPLDGSDGILIIGGSSDETSSSSLRQNPSRSAGSKSLHGTLSDSPRKASMGLWSIFGLGSNQKNKSLSSDLVPISPSGDQQPSGQPSDALSPGGVSLRRVDSRRFLSSMPSLIRQSSSKLLSKKANFRNLNPRGSSSTLSYHTPENEAVPSTASASARRQGPLADVGEDEEALEDSSKLQPSPLSPRQNTTKSLLVIKASSLSNRRPGLRIPSSSGLRIPSSSVTFPEEDGLSINRGTSNMTRKLVQRGGVVQEINMRGSSGGSKLSKSSAMMQKLSNIDPTNPANLAAVSRNPLPSADASSSQVGGWVPPFESPPGHELDGMDAVFIPPPPPQPLAARSISMFKQTFAPIDEDRSCRPDANTEKPLGRSSAAIGGEKPLGRTSTLVGGGRRGQTNSALAALAAADWTAPKKPSGQPFLFESPPGHENDGFDSGAGSQPSIGKKERGLSTRSVGFMASSSPFQTDGSQISNRHRLATEGAAGGAAGEGQRSTLGPKLSRQLTAERAYDLASSKVNRPLGRSSAALVSTAEAVKAPSLDPLSRGSTGGSRSLSNVASPHGSNLDLSSMAQHAEASSSQHAVVFTSSPQTIRENEELEFVPRPGGVVEEEHEGHGQGEGERGEESFMLSEFRMRLLSGLRQCYQAKYDDGTLGARAFLILSHVVDNANHTHHKPLDLWEHIRNEIGHGLLMRMEVKSYYWLKSRHTQLKASNNPLSRYLLPPLLVGPMWLVGQDLHRAMLVSLETAAELWISLTDGLQTSWLSYAGEEGEVLLSEVEAQVDAAYEFIVERRIESPEAFAALQTHRALIHLLSKQVTFVREMTQGGLIGATESRRLLEVLEKISQRVRTRGPRTKKRGVRKILGGVNFLRDQDPQVVDWLRRQGTTKIYTKGEVIWEPSPPSSIPDINKQLERSFKAAAAPTLGTFIVISGVVRMELALENGVEPVYLGAGGVGGLVATLLGGSVPGMDIVGIYAEGNSLGKGPVVLRLPPALFTAIEHLSRDERLASYQKLEVGMFRTASVLILDLLRSQVMDQLSHYLVDSMRDVLKDEEGTFISRRTRLRVLLREGQVAAELSVTAMDLDVWVNELVRLHQISPITAFELLERGEPDEENWADLDEDADKIPNQVWQSSMFRAIDTCIQGIFDLIKGSVRSETSRLICLSPGQVIFQHLTMVLIQGTLCAEEEVEAPWLPIKDKAEISSSSRQPHFVASPNESHVAPSVMVWIPDFWGYDHEVARGMRIKAGPSGATLLVNLPSGMDASVMSRP